MPNPVFDVGRVVVDVGRPVVMSCCWSVGRSTSPATPFVHPWLCSSHSASGRSTHPLIRRTYCSAGTVRTAAVLQASHGGPIEVVSAKKYTALFPPICTDRPTSTPTANAQDGYAEAWDEAVRRRHPGRSQAAMAVCVASTDSATREATHIIKELEDDTAEQ